jgi:hypothetical protein
MNTTRTPRDTPDTPVDLGAWDLPPRRRRALKDALLRRIDAEAAPAPAVRAPRLLRPAVVVPACLMAVTATVFTAVTDATDGRAGRADRPAASARHADAAAVVWLDRAATVSARTDAVPVRDDQYVYVRSLVRSNTGAFGGPVHLSPRHTQEMWLLQKRGRVKHVGALRESGPGAEMPGRTVPIEDYGRSAPGVHRPTYAWLAALPTDPDELLALLRGEVRPVEGESVDHAVFGTIGDLLAQTLVPPRTAAALYRVAARLPGVTVTRDTVDAAGRHGVGITLDDGVSATRNEWIFDRTTLAFLGSRSYFTGRDGRPDVLFDTSAVLVRAVVDAVGELPADRRGGEAA